MKNNAIKICSFYVNETHLAAMILPYINQTIKKEKKVLTIFQNGILNHIEEILSKMNLKTGLKEEILQINWTSNKTCKYEKIKQEIEEKAKLVDAIDIFIKGTEEYIEIANTNVEKVIKNLKGKEINIINCYDITIQKDITKILDKHDFVLNTSGVKQIQEVFTDYKKEVNNSIQQNS